MTITDPSPSPSPDFEAPPEAPAKRRRRRWPIYVALAIILFGTFVVLFALGVGDASAAGGCGGG
jgi:hypothetical protein